MPRKSIVVGILMVLALLVADVALASVENQRAASAIARSQDLKVKPYIHINGWPFFVQGIRGHYRYVTVQADPAHTSGAERLDIHPLKLHLRGVVTHGGFDGATAQSAKGSARIGYRSLSKVLGQRVRFAGNGLLGAVVKVRVNGHTFKPTVTAKPKISGNGLVFDDVAVTDEKGLPASSADKLEKIFSTHVDLGTFPFDLRPTKLKLGGSGLIFDVSGHDLKLGTKS